MAAVTLVSDAAMSVEDAGSGVQAMMAAAPSAAIGIHSISPHSDDAPQTQPSGHADGISGLFQDFIENAILRNGCFLQAAAAAGELPEQMDAKRMFESLDQFRTAMNMLGFMPSDDDPMAAPRLAEARRSGSRAGDDLDAQPARDGSLECSFPHSMGKWTCHS